MLAARAKIAKSTFIYRIYSDGEPPSGSTVEVVAPCKVIAGLLQLALTMNAGLVSRSRVDLLLKKKFNFDSRHGVARDDHHDERQVEWCEQPVGWC